jgi:hypothetical protein
LNNALPLWHIDAVKVGASIPLLWDTTALNQCAVRGSNKHAPLADQLGETQMDLLIVLILVLLLFGGGGGLYWGMGAGWGIGPIGLILAVIVVAYLLNGYRGRRGPRL